MFQLLDIIGTMAFAMSGALTAMNKKMDPFGVFIIAFVTAVGGGTLRDVLIGRTPVGWMLDLKYAYVIIAAFILSIIFRKKIDRLRTWLRCFYINRTVERNKDGSSSSYLYCFRNDDCLFWWSYS